MEKKIILIDKEDIKLVKKELEEIINKLNEVSYE